MKYNWENLPVGTLPPGSHLRCVSVVERQAVPRFYVGLHAESTEQGQLENIGQTYTAFAAKLI